MPNWKYDPGQPLSTRRTCGFPEKYRSVILQVGRNLFLEKTRVPTIDIGFERMSKVTMQNFEVPNLFDGAEMPLRDALIWNWGHTSLLKLIKSTGFVYPEKLSHYEFTKQRADFLVMRDSYFELIDRYRADGYRVANIKNNHGFSKI